MALSPATILLIGGMMIFALFFSYIILRVFGLVTSDTSELDRLRIEKLGNEQIEYSDPYFAKLTKPSRVGENLPTRSCDNCGGPLNPTDEFCSKCGQRIE